MLKYFITMGGRETTCCEDKVDLTVHSDTVKSLTSYSYSKVTAFTICVQIAGLVIVYLLGFIFYYDSLMKSHCNVPNIWPTLSKSTGDHLPGRYVWRLAVSLTVFPRITDAIVYYNYYSQKISLLFIQKPNLYRWLNKLSFSFSILELFLFCTITFVSLKEHIDIYLYAWSIYLASSICYKVTVLLLINYLNEGSEVIQSVVLHSAMLCVQVVAVASWLYFFSLHVWHCTPYAFTVVAISECVIVASNIGFKAVQIVDFSWLKTSHDIVCIIDESDKKRT